MKKRILLVVLAALFAAGTVGVSRILHRGAVVNAFPGDG